ncbi:AI-2E family transporter [Phytohalomonas tamaricis]|uniref:AI-2E family transporter n=1 Tax=Phytohalomonas tamaricis TaxID=2081032 RepID=UPI001319E6E0|nr:AI-2E family transporter [Phytohalomonas tamaricis]
MREPDGSHRLSEYARKVWISTGIIALTVMLLLVVWFGLEILLLAFAGLLLALALSLPASWLGHHSFLSQRWALVIVLIAITGLFTLFCFNFASNITQQFQLLMQVLPNSLSGLEQQMHGWPLGDQLLDQVEQFQSGGNVFKGWFSRFEMVFSSTFGAAFNIVFILFIGLYVAFEPGTYEAGLLQLVPARQRSGTADLLEEIKHKMAWWLVGRLVSMSVIGVLTGLGLWWLGIPMAFSLSLLAGLLVFIPNVGPIIAAVPALLVAFSQSTSAMWHVLVLYIAVQTLESYLITPYVQRRVVKMPPGLLITLQVALGLVSGAVGLLMAGPLLVLLMVLIKRLYVENWQGEKMSKEGG